MKHIRIYLVLLLSWNLAIAQNQTDTLENQLNKLNGEKKLDLLIHAAGKVSTTCPEKSVLYAGRAFKLASDLKLPARQADAASLLSDGYLQLSKTDSSGYFAQKSMDLYTKADNRVGIVQARNQLGLVSLNKDDFEKAEKIFTQTVTECHSLLQLKSNSDEVKNIETEAFNNLIITYVKQGNYKRAKEKLLRFSKETHYGSTFSGMIIQGNLALVYQMLGQYDSALIFAANSLNISILLKDEVNSGKIYSDIGNISYEMGGYTEAIDNFSKAIAIFLSSDDRQKLSRTYNNLASVYMQINYYEKATTYFIASLKIKEELRDSSGLAATYNNLGLVYSARNNPELARKYYSMAVNINTIRKNKKALSVNFNALGEHFLKEGQTDSALLYFTKSLELKQLIGYKLGIVISLQEIGSVYSELKKFTLSEEYYQKALLLAEEINSQHEIANLNLSLAEIYFQQNDLSRAREMMKKTLEYAVHENALELIQESSRFLTEISIRTGDKKAAESYFGQYRMAGDSLYSKNKTETILEMQTRFESDKKERENNRLAELNSIQLRQIRALIVVSLVLLILGLVILFLFRLKNKAYRQIVKNNVEIAEKEKRSEAERNKAKAERETGETNLPIHDITNTTLGLLVKLNRLMDEEKPYLETGITIEDCCRMLSTNRTYLSQLINENYKLNFNNFINGYRITEARRLLLDPRFGHISIEGIGSMAGFSSKVTFHSSFKKQIGVTPSYFRKTTAETRNSLNN